MMFNDVTLGSFLMLFVGKYTKNAQFNIINTDNESFPKEYRMNNITASSFWANIYRQDENAEIFNRYIDFICLLPKDVDVFKPLDYELIYDFNSGFYSPVRDDNEKTGYKFKAPVIHITLKPEDYMPR